MTTKKEIKSEPVFENEDKFPAPPAAVNIGQKRGRSLDQKTEPSPPKRQRTEGQPSKKASTQTQHIVDNPTTILKIPITQKGYFVFSGGSGGSSGRASARPGRKGRKSASPSPGASLDQRVTKQEEGGNPEGRPGPGADDLDETVLNQYRSIEFCKKDQQKRTEGRLRRLQEIYAHEVQGGNLNENIKKEKAKLIHLENNRKAAKISREKKKRYIRDLEERVDMFSKHIATLEMENAELRNALEQGGGTLPGQQPAMGGALGGMMGQMQQMMMNPQFMMQMMSMMNPMAMETLMGSQEGSPAPPDPSTQMQMPGMPGMGAPMPGAMPGMPGQMPGQPGQPAGDTKSGVASAKHEGSPAPPANPMMGQMGMMGGMNPMMGGMGGGMMGGMPGMPGQMQMPGAPPAQAMPAGGNDQVAQSGFVVKNEPVNA